MALCLWLEMMGVFTSWKLANTTNQGELFASTYQQPLPGSTLKDSDLIGLGYSLGIRIFKTMYKHTTKYNCSSLKPSTQSTDFSTGIIRELVRNAEPLPPYHPWTIKSESVL